MGVDEPGQHRLTPGIDGLQMVVLALQIRGGAYGGYLVAQDCHGAILDDGVLVIARDDGPVLDQHVHSSVLRMGLNEGIRLADCSSGVKSQARGGGRHGALLAPVDGDLPEPTRAGGGLEHSRKPLSCQRGRDLLGVM